jgi:hypothetical protein
MMDADDLVARLRADADRQDRYDESIVSTNCMRNAADHIEKLEEALDPFSRVAGLVEPLADDWDDERPAKDILPGIWPTWGDLKRARSVLHSNNGGDE